MKELSKSENFCVAPWMHLHVINDGRAFPCCMTPIEDENAVGNVKTQHLFDVMNSDKMKEMRKDMLNNKPLPESCNRCKVRQSSGINTMRTGLNNKWFDKAENLIASTKDDGTITDLELRYWDFRFSNYCNLACTTCAPLFSTQWADDWQKLHPQWDLSKETRLIDLKQASIFWDDIERNIDTMEEIHFAGGEPLIMPEHWRILKLLDEREKYNVDLRYSTNGTTLGKGKEDVIAYWRKFNYVHLSLSIDGANETFEHIRYKGKWKPTLENMKRIRQSGAVDYWVHPTISILNIFRLTELHEILHKEDLLPLEQIHPNRSFFLENYWVDRFHLNPLFIPDHLNLTVLTPLLKEKAAEHLTSYGKKLEADTGIPFSGWQTLIDFMYQADNSERFYQFIEETKKLDAIRGTNAFRLNPELEIPYA